MDGCYYSKTNLQTYTSNFVASVNPKSWLCEGNKIKNQDGTIKFVGTGEFTSSPTFKKPNQSINKWDCNSSPGSLNNNVENINMTIPLDGNGLLTSPCLDANQNIGPKRDCEFQMTKPFESCTPSTLMKLSCYNIGLEAQVIRICESSIELGTGTACRYNDSFTLLNEIVLPTQSKTMYFRCPGPKDVPAEVGGKYSIYVGNLFNINNNALPSLMCQATTSSTFILFNFELLLVLCLMIFILL